MREPMEAQVWPMSAQEMGAASPDELRTFMRDSTHAPLDTARMIGWFARRFDADLVRRVFPRVPEAGLALVANPYLDAASGAAFVEAMCGEEPSELRSGMGQKVLWVLMRRGDIPLSGRVLNQLETSRWKYVRSQDSDPTREGYYRYLRSVDAFREANEISGGRQPEHASLLLASYRLEGRERGPGERDPGGEILARHPQVRVEDLLRLFAEYPNGDLARAVSEQAQGGGVLRNPVLRCFLHEYRSLGEVALALLRTPEVEDFAETAEAIWEVSPRELERALLSPSVEPRYLALLPERRLLELLTHAHADLRLKAILASALRNTPARERRESPGVGRER